MKLVKSLLLGSAAGIAAVAGAQAADLPSRKAAPVEYVRVCTAYGAGFFYIPGTDTCLRISGRVRAEYVVGERYGESDAYGTRARGRLNIDARTQTAYGTLRTFIRYELTNN
ncbi:porin, partial [Bosea sp. CER48]|uniref:porin n=1 Tax=Bosea sp. CER48 TaxID=3377035 RepID=UPI0037F1FAED